MFVFCMNGLLCMQVQPVIGLKFIQKKPQFFRQIKMRECVSDSVPE